MKIEQKKWTAQKGWEVLSTDSFSEVPQLVLAFSSSQLAREGKIFEEIRQMYPQSHILQASTAGEIISNEVNDDSVALSAIFFEKTTLEFHQEAINDPLNSLEVGRKLSTALSKDNLRHVLVFSDGLKVNGSALVQGLIENLKGVSITGGLVGDGSNFKNTYIGLDALPQEGIVVIVGLYGDSLNIGYGSLGGWDPFGPARLITKSDKNILYELDNRPALDLYKEYLGELSSGLPGTGLLFPLSLRLKGNNDSEVEVVRTLLAVDETQKSMTFAGDMPEGIYAKLMKANFDRIIDGASTAANMTTESIKAGNAEFALLISCIGRKLVLKERIEEEIEAVQQTLGSQTKLTGFYSYGEICPTSPTEKQCQLHNQTMTITTFRES